MPNTCIVWKCKNMGVFCIPKDDALRKQWIEVLKLDVHKKVGRKLSANSHVCCSHFKPTDIISRNWPDAAGIRNKRYLKRNVVPSIFDCTGQPCCSDPLHTKVPMHIKANNDEDFSPSAASITYSKEVLPTKFVQICPDFGPNTMDSLAYENNTEQDPLADDVDSTLSDEVDPNNNTSMIMEPILSEDNKVTDYACNIEISSSNLDDPFQIPPQPLSQFCTSKQDRSVQTDNITTSFSIQSIKHVDKTVHFYTGLECYSKVMLVFSTLGVLVNNLKYFYENPPSKIDPLDQFFITLIILYRHKTFEEIANLFLITIKQVYNIFVTWIRFMSLQWQNLDIWPDKETIRAYMPRDFYDKFPSTRVVLDATECPIKRPKMPLAQQITFSTYKNKNTVKFMIGITPGGLISYVSPCYGGSMSDRQIIERSSILNKFDYGDEIMVDKGINVQDIFISQGVKVNMPAFFKKGNQIQPDTLMSNRKVASKRVHVERIIGMLKTFKILTQPMNHTETILASDIAFVCAMLVNFRSGVVNKNA